MLGKHVFFFIDVVKKCSFGNLYCFVFNSRRPYCFWTWLDWRTTNQSNIICNMTHKNPVVCSSFGYNLQFDLFSAAVSEIGHPVEQIEEGLKRLHLTRLVLCFTSDLFSRPLLLNDAGFCVWPGFSLRLNALPLNSSTGLECVARSPLQSTSVNTKAAYPLMN